MCEFIFFRRPSTEPAFPRVPGDVPPPQPDRNRQGEDDAPEDDAERRDHNLLRNAQLREHHCACQKVQTPANNMRDKSGLLNLCIHRRDQRRLGQEIPEEHSA